MDIRKVKKLIEMLEESAIDEIEIHEDKDSVRVSRNQHAPAQVAGAAPARELQAAAQHSAPAVEPAPAPEPAEAEEPEDNIIRSPMVGIFYEAQAPGKPSFVELGQTVAKGDVLCIIEAMKIMNQVESEKAGVVSRIMANNGEPVEYGQPLFIIRDA
ncbi:MAG: acetyl-CoA carboxylase biotin carboxyl carrier protein [Gammaproteobacteria bacterium]|nr:acetyl-CoA carboxylase biotin carboxyl carrier protein [Gammaproteobacteria bacterium]